MFGVILWIGIALAKNVFTLHRVNPAQEDLPLRLLRFAARRDQPASPTSSPRKPPLWCAHRRA